MNGNRDRRLARLEQAHLEQEPETPAQILYVWRDAPRESADAAIARRFPKGVPAGRQLVICSWQIDGERLLPAGG